MRRSREDTELGSVPTGVNPSSALTEAFEQSHLWMEETLSRGFGGTMWTSVWSGLVVVTKDMRDAKSQIVCI